MNDKPIFTNSDKCKICGARIVSKQFEPIGSDAAMQYSQCSNGHVTDMRVTMPGQAWGRDMTLEHALRIVKNDAEKIAKQHRDKVGLKPLAGWSQEKHDEYHLGNAEEATTAAYYCFIRLMQIDPD